MPEAPTGNDTPEIPEDQLSSWKLLGEFRRVLGKVTSNARPRPQGGPKRLLLEDHYLTSFLFAQLNPVITSMRGLCGCSGYERVQEEVSGRQISLGSFSEAQQVFGHERLQEVFADMLRKSPDAIAPPGGTARSQCLKLVDSSVFAALPRMDWAEWRHQGKTQRAVRLHLKFNVLRGEPGESSITSGRTCERAAFKKMIKPGEFYVCDRNYSRSYALLGHLDEQGCGYLIRLLGRANVTTVEKLPLTDEDRTAGVVSDQHASLGSEKGVKLEQVRILRIEKEGLDEPIILVTNRLDPTTHSAALLAEIYRGRWEIELFFRWFKCILGRAGQWHWFAESPEGVSIQIYSALIAGLLLARHAGKLPSKRQMEAIQLHAMGWLRDSELEKVLGKALARKRS